MGISSYKQLKKLSPPFQRCDEQIVDGSCSRPSTDDCCAIVPCALCLLLEEYPSETKAKAVGDGTQWSASIGGHTFLAYWENVYGECEFVILWDGDEVQRLPLCPMDYEDGVSCRFPSPPPFEVPTGYGEAGILTVTPTEKIQLPHYEDPTVRCETLDICIVVDDTGSMEAVIDEFKSNIVDLVAQAEAISESNQYALITFKDSVTTDLPFSVGNGSAMISAVNALAAVGGGNVPEASDYALEAAVDLAGWRASDVARRKVIILVTDAVPGGLDDVQDLPTDTDKLIAEATRAGDNGIILVAINAGGSEVGSILQQAVAANGDKGRYVSSVDTMITRIQGLLEIECPQRPPCLEPYCGDLTCTEKFICLTVTGPDGFSYTSDPIENNTDYDGCQLPAWDISVIDGYFEVTGTIALVRDDYTGACELSVPGANGYDQTAAISGTSPLTATWEVESDDPYADPYVFSIVGSDCGDCDPPGDPCLLSVCPPSVTVVFPFLTNGNCNDCSAMDCVCELVSCEITNDSPELGDTSIAATYHSPTLDRGACGDSSQ